MAAYLRFIQTISSEEQLSTSNKTESPDENQDPKEDTKTKEHDVELALGPVKSKFKIPQQFAILFAFGVIGYGARWAQRDIEFNTLDRELSDCKRRLPGPPTQPDDGGTRVPFDSAASEQRTVNETPRPAISEAVQQCINSAGTTRPYVILGLSMLWTFEKRSGGSYVADLRNVYTLLLLRDIDSMNEFREGQTSSRALLTRWWGPQRESNTGNEGIYDVQIHGRRGDVRVITTGVRMTHRSPPPERAAFSGVTVPAGVEYVIYPNDEDYICHMTITVQSSSFTVTPFGNGAYISHRVGSAEQTSYIQQPPGAPRPLVERSFSAAWDNVVPHDRMGLLFRLE